MNILIVGVGGQGTLLASRILGAYAIAIGDEAKINEVHGMSQRGGSVVTHVRTGKDICSPIVEVGDADIVLAFEQLEALRWKHYLKDGGRIVVNTQQIMPMPVILGAVIYPSDIEQCFNAESAHFVDALSLAESAGSAKCVNIVIIGVLTRLVGFEYETMRQVISDSVPPKFRDLNLRAFESGYNSLT